MEYRELLAAIGRMTGLDAGPARAAAEATLTTLARTLEDEDRQQLIEALPPEPTDDFPLDHPRNDGTEEGCAPLTADAVTALDVELANRVDEVIEEMGAGIGGPS
jgi:hypothetical protein